MGCPALGQKRTSRQLERMSALPPIADIGTQSWNVRFVPKADIMRCSKLQPIRSHRRRGRAALGARSGRAPWPSPSANSVQAECSKPRLRPRGMRALPGPPDLSPNESGQRARWCSARCGTCPSGSRRNLELIGSAIVMGRGPIDCRAPSGNHRG